MECLIIATQLIILLQDLTSVAQNVYWTVSNDTLVIGEDVELWCNTTSMDGNCDGCPLLWTGGYGNGILSRNGLSRDDTKYEVPSGDKGNRLIIKDLNKDDIVWKYTCSYGFEKYSNNLISRRSYLYLPKNDTVSVDFDVQERTIVGEIILEEVHPVPECKLHLNGEDFTSMLGTEIIQKGLFNQIKYNLTCNISPNMCEARLQMDCIFGHTKTTIENRKFNFTCNIDMQNWYNNKELHVISGIILTSLLVIITWLIVSGRSEIPGNVFPLCSIRCQRDSSTEDVISNDGVIEIEQPNRNTSADSFNVIHVDIHTSTTNTSTMGKGKEHVPCDSSRFEVEPFLETNIIKDVCEEDPSINDNAPKQTTQRQSIKSAVSKKTKQLKPMIKQKSVISSSVKPQRRGKFRSWKGGFYHKLCFKKGDKKDQRDDKNKRVRV